MKFDGSKPGPGRPRGAQNQPQKEIRNWCQKLARDPVFRKNFKARMQQMRIHPSVLLEVLNRAYGRLPPGDIGPNGGTPVQEVVKIYLPSNQRDVTEPVLGQVTRMEEPAVVLELPPRQVTPSE